MLYPAICQSYEAAAQRMSAVDGVSTVRSAVTAAADIQARPSLFETTATTFLRHRELGEEVFGPSTLVVRCGSRREMEAVACRLEGQLTATIHGTAPELTAAGWLVAILEDKAGRLLVNGFPTGVEVCASMQHGGPYPATTDSRTTSVGTAAIARFVRPVAYQNFPSALLPLELQDANPRVIWRTVDGTLTKDAVV
jgi:NADP-dependent aldehyde dehydrogenase